MITMTVVTNMMKHNIVESIVKYQNDFDKLNELMVLCGGIKYGDGYSIDDLYSDVHEEVHNVQNYWLNEEYPYSKLNKDWLNQFYMIL